MKHIFNTVAFLALFCCTALPAYAESSIIPEDGYDVRKVRWGMSTEQVKKVETAEFVNYEDYGLLYRTKMLGKDCYLHFGFHNNKLWAVTYSFYPDSEIEAKQLFKILGRTCDEKYLRFGNLITDMIFGTAYPTKQYKTSRSYIGIIYSYKENSKIVLSYIDANNLNKIQSNADNALFGTRNTRWDITKEQVKQIEISKYLVYESENRLEYSIDINNKYCHLMYWFNDNKLFAIMYLFEPHSQQEAEQIYTIIETETDNKYSVFENKNKKASNPSDSQRFYTTPYMDIEVTNQFSVSGAVFVAYIKRID